MTELRSAVRALAAARGFTAVAILTLGLGLALSITVLTVVNAYVLRTLPYPAAERLYRVDYGPPGQNPPVGMEAIDWRSLDTFVDCQIAWDLDVFYMLGADFPESAPGAWVTPGYMEGFGIRAAMGRAFAPNDFQPGSQAVAMISHRIWQTRFGGSADAIGRTFQAYVSDRPDEAETFTIVGVLPAELWHFNAYSEVLAPLRAATYPYQIRVRTGVAAPVVAERLTALVRTHDPSLPEDWQVRLTGQQAGYLATVRPMLWAVGTVAGLVLLIAGANVALLMLIRGRRREKELAVRLALGASHLRLARLLVYEGLVIGVGATLVGLMAASAGMVALAPLIERFLDRRVPGGTSALTLDGTVIAVASVCSLTITLIFTLTPLLATWQTTLLPAMGVARGATEGPAPRRTRAMLIGLEVAASLTLLAGAAMMAQGAIRMLRVDFGIETERVATAGLSLRQRSYPDSSSRVALYDRLLTELPAIAGMSGVAIGDWWPLQQARPRRVQTLDQPSQEIAAAVSGISVGYFETLGMPRIEGRDFTRQDDIGAERVAIVSASLARRLWPASSAVGQQITVAADNESRPLLHRVIGTVGDTRQTHADTDLFDVYLPLAQNPGRFAFMYLRDPRSATWEADLKAAVARIDREVAVGTPRWLEAAVDQERVKPRFLAWLLTVFAALACGLALVGMHGVIAYATGQRQREIAVRIAMGATRPSVTGLFMRQGAAILIGGLAAGVAGAVALGRLLQSLLYGVQPGDPALLAAATVAFAASGLLAVWWPAWRAGATDPAQVLKEQ